MPRLTNVNPSYRRHRVSGRAVVTLDGRDHYLGTYGTKASRLEYDRLIGEWLSNGRRSPDAVADLTVVELIAAYLKHAEAYCCDAAGELTLELSALKLPMRVLGRLYWAEGAAVLTPFLKVNPTAHLFCPADSDAAHRARRAMARKTPTAYGNVPGSNRKPHPRKSPGGRYTVNVYRQAVARGCDHL